jgi:ABC-type Fe3+/spermidine/putrescine transport system ATPase subunit
MTLCVKLHHQFPSFDLDVRFDAPSGITGLFGRSGAGKTSVIRAVAGLLRPNNGRIVLGDRVLFGDGVHVPPHLRRIGYVFQEPRLFPHLTVRQNLTYGGRANFDQVIDMLGMMGDAVDNIPGIPGVGEKTAAKLLKEYGSLENVLENAATIKGALGEKIRNGKEKAIMSKKLATIITNVPVEFHEEDYKLKDWNKEALTEIFTSLEFKTMAKRILGETLELLDHNNYSLE